MSLHTGQFTIQRTIKASQDRLWHLLIDPHARTEWGAPSDDHVLEMVRHDVREGGQDLHRCGPANNPEFEVATHWYHLGEQDSACFTEVLEMGGTRLSVSLVGYDLRAIDGGTELNITVTVTSLVGEDMTDDHHEGWTSALNRMEQIIARETADA